MARRSPTWFQLSWDMMKLGVEAQSVIALRTLKMAAGGPEANAEIGLMVAEKAKAVVDVQFEMAKSALSGQAHLGPSRAVALYRRRVRANQRRLLRKA